MPNMNEIAEQVAKYCTDLGLKNCLLIIAASILALLFLNSRTSGWHALARYYPVGNPYQGEWFSDDEYEIELRIGNITTNAVKVGANAEGIYLSQMLLFRPFHPPLFIPWRDVTLQWKKELPWFKKANAIELTFAHTPDVPVYIAPFVAEELEKRSEGQWQMTRQD